MSIRKTNQGNKQKPKKISPTHKSVSSSQLDPVTFKYLQEYQDEVEEAIRYARSRGMVWDEHDNVYFRHSEAQQFVGYDQFGQPIFQNDGSGKKRVTTGLVVALALVGAGIGAKLLYDNNTSVRAGVDNIVVDQLVKQQPIPREEQVKISKVFDDPSPRQAIEEIAQNTAPSNIYATMSSLPTDPARTRFVLEKWGNYNNSPLDTTKDFRDAGFSEQFIDRLIDEGGLVNGVYRGR